MELSEAQRKHLKSMGHALHPVVMGVNTGLNPLYWRKSMLPLITIN